VLASAGVAAVEGHGAAARVLTQLDAARRLARRVNSSARMMFKLGLASLCSMTLVFAVTSAGCDSVDRIYDCSSICNAYKDCVDDDYDVAACTSECRDNAAESESYEDRADDCQECIDDRSCAGAVFGCAAECVGIVP
jgi:hypothetical protein